VIPASGERRYTAEAIDFFLADLGFLVQNGIRVTRKQETGTDNKLIV
jgi:hypothetical protein